METQVEFYCIKLINRDGTRGWLFDSPDGIKVITDGVNSDITQFENIADANNFIRYQKLERKGVKAFVRTSQELIEEGQKLGIAGISTRDKPTFHLENQKGEKCFYDSTRDAYCFKPMGESGYPFWESEEDTRAFVKEMDFEQSMIFLVKTDKGNQDKTLIQVYGCAKKEDGTMSEHPEYINIQEGGKH